MPGRFFSARFGRVALGLLLLLAPAMLEAATEALFYYVPSEDGWQSLSANARKISILAPQVFILDASGAVRGEVEERVRSLASAHGMELMPLLINDQFSSELAARVLRDRAFGDRVIADTLQLCEKNGCHGLQLDLEGILTEDHARYVDFIRRAAAVFHARKLRLSVAMGSPLFPGSLPPSHYAKVTGNFPVLTEWYDMAEIARHVDFISLMTYDNYSHGSAPGPIGGYAWVEQTLQYLLPSVPPGKILLGLGLYGRRWCNQKVWDSDYRGIAELLHITGAQIRWHPWHRSPWFEYNQEGCRNIVWFENRRSLREKLRLVRRYRLAGFCAWRLGQEDPEFWRELRDAR